VSICSSSFSFAQYAEQEKKPDTITAEVILKKTRLIQYRIDQAQSERKEVTSLFDES
jgi:hypothetical protein